MSLIKKREWLRAYFANSAFSLNTKFTRPNDSEASRFPSGLRLGRSKLFWMMSAPSSV